jgi:hypothetical protein
MPPTDWLHQGPTQSFAVTQNQLRTDGHHSLPNWIHTRREYENFRLRFDYKLDQWTEAAVYLRAPRSERPAGAGLAIVLAHDFHQKVTPYVTGAIRGVREPAGALPESWGQWLPADITLDGDHLTASINGKAVQDVRLDVDPALRHRLKRGHIGFPDLGYGYTIRNIEIEDRGSRHQFVSLWNGHSLEGWDLRGGANWTIRDGAIRTFNGHGVLYAPGEFGDFEFTAVVRSHQRANGGVFLRGGPSGYRGFEIQIYSPPDAVYPTGSIYNHIRSSTPIDYEEQWFLLQVVLQGRRCLVLLDGELVAETAALPPQVPAKGRIGLQMHSDNASIEFRDLRVRELPRQPATPLTPPVDL